MLFCFFTITCRIIPLRMFNNHFFSAFLLDKLHQQELIQSKSILFFRSCICLFLLIFSLGACFGQVDGDFRSTTSGNWSTSTTWQRYNGTTWDNSGSGSNNPGQTPSAASAVWIQTGHTVTLTGGASCNDLHLNVATGETRLALGSNTLNLNGKIRAYSGSAGMIPGTSSPTPSATAGWITSTTGKISVVGNTRTLTFSGEWGANNAGTASPNGFDLEINLNSGQAVTINTSFKARSFNVFAGSLVVAGSNRLAPDTGAASNSNFSIQSGASVVSDQSGTGGSAVIGRTGSGIGGVLNIASGALLRLNGTSPTVAMTTITNNGTIEYGASGNQTFVAATNSGAAAMSSYNNVVISGSGIKTAAVATAIAGTTTVNAGTTLSTGAFTITVSGTATINGTFQISQGGFANTGVGGSYVYGSNGTLAYTLSSGTYGPVDNTHVYWPATNGPVNVTMTGTGSAAVNLGVSRTVPGTFLLVSGANMVQGAALTLNGTTQINGGNFQTTPTYGSSSTLVYNTTYTTSNEWTGGATTSVAAGSGIPANVQILSGNLTLAGGRGVPGNLTVTSGGLILNATAGDLYIGGNLTHSGTTWTNNTRAVVFVGTGTSIINTSANSGVQFFDYLLVNKSSGSVQIGSTTNVTINTTAGSVLQFLNAGTLDLNGRTLTMNNNGGNILVDGSTGGTTKSIVSTTGTGTIAITNNKTVTGSSSGTLSTSASVQWVLTGGINFGGLTTINGILQINAGGFVTTNAPTYGTGSLLRYNSGANPFNRTIEWSASSGAGYPFNVQISNNTTLSPGGSSNTATALNVANNLTIDAGSNLYMDFGSNNMTVPLIVNNDLTITGNLSASGASGGDIIVKGHWNRTGSFGPNSRAVFFQGSNPQTLTGTTTFDFLLIDKTSGSFILNNNITVNQTLTFTAPNVVNIQTGSNNVVIASAGSITRTGSGHIFGNLQRTVANGNNVFHIGTSTVYAPATINMTGVTASVQILGNVSQGSHPNEATSGIDVNKKADHYWTMTKSGAGTFTSYTATFNVANTTNTGTVANYKVAKFDSPSTWSSVGGSTSGNDVTSASFTSFSDFIVGEIDCIPPTGLTYSSNTVSYCTLVAISTNVPSFTGSAATSYAISTSLPTGLNFNTMNGEITGTPTATISATDYTITVTNSCGNTSRVINITVNQAPSSLSYTNNNAAYCLNTSITANIPTFTGSTATSYAISPALPTGLNINSSTGDITGTPTTISTATDYTVTVTNPCGSTTKVINISVNDRPTAGTCKTDDLCQTNSASITVEASGGTAPYTVAWTPTHGSPSSPQSISTSGGTLIISGLSGGTTYNIVVTDANSCLAP